MSSAIFVGNLSVLTDLSVGSNTAVGRDLNIGGSCTICGALAVAGDFYLPGVTDICGYSGPVIFDGAGVTQGTAGTFIFSGGGGGGAGWGGGVGVGVFPMRHIRVLDRAAVVHPI